MTDATLPDIEGRPKGGFLKKALFMLIFAAVLGGGGFGAGLYFAGEQLSPSQEVLRLIEQNNAEAEAQEGTDGPKRIPKELPEKPVFETSYYEFPDPLTTNLKDSRRFVQIGIGLSTQYDATVIANVEKHAMALRSDMLAVLSGFTEQDMEGKAGRDRLAEELRVAINERLETLEGFGGIENIFFPSYVLQ